jgi:hypothetical protein
MIRLILFFAVILFSMACNNKSEETTTNNEAFIHKGDSIVKITFDTLRTALTNAIGQKGFTGALQYCNVQALPITSLYASHDITINRVSDKNRNPANALSELDKLQWEKFKIAFEKKDSLRAAIVDNKEDIHYYKPILMQGMCLSCHGTPDKEISKELLTQISTLYPEDKATGYKTGDLRGMWHVLFKKKNMPIE